MPPVPETTSPATTPDQNSDGITIDVTSKSSDDEIQAKIRQAYYDNAYGAIHVFQQDQSIPQKDLDAFKKFLEAAPIQPPQKDAQLQARIDQLKPKVIDEVAPKFLSSEGDPQGNFILKSYDPTPKANNTATSGDPVNLFNGNFLYSVSDFQISGAGMDFVFERTYSQLVDYSGPLGSHWDHSANLWLREQDNNQILLRSDGMLYEESFHRHEQFDYWIPEDAARGVLLANGDSYLLRLSNGTQVIYQPHPFLQPGIHIISRIQDRLGNYLAFSYTDGLLSQVEVNHPERLIDFHYDTQNRIIAIVDFTNRSWRYGYEDLGNLVSVTTPPASPYRNGLTTIYEYSSGLVSDPNLQHNLISILDAGGQLYLENEYGVEPNQVSYRRVIRQRQGGGDTLYEYEDVVEEFDYPYADHERPQHQTLVTGRDGHQVRYLFNYIGNMILKEEYARVDGIPQIVSTHYRYNPDGNLVAILSPLGVLEQALYGRDIYERRFPLGNDYRPESDPNLTQEARLQFDNLLAVVKRGRYYDLNALNLAIGLWSSALFPDILQADSEDAVQKFTYEPEFSQSLTVSDPRFTQSADPAFPEGTEYDRHLTRYAYSPGQGFQHLLLESLAYPTPSLPDGTLSAPLITNFTEYDPHGRILRVIATNGLEMDSEYSPPDVGLLEGFLKTTTVDPDGFNIKRGVERDLLGRIVKIFRPPFFDFNNGRYFNTFEYNALGQQVSSTTTAPFSIQSNYLYDRAGNLSQSTLELKDQNNLPTGSFVTRSRYDEEFHLVFQQTGDIDSITVKQVKVSYDRAARPILSIAPSGRLRKTIYNERAQVAKTIQDYGKVHAITRTYYDADGRPIRVIDPRGNVTRFTYDAFGRIFNIEDAQGNRTLQQHDKIGNLLIECRFQKDSANNFVLLDRREYSYDEIGRTLTAGVYQFTQASPVTADHLLDTLQASGPGDLLITQFFYDNGGNLVKQVDPDGRQFLAEFDILGRLTKTTDPFGNETSLRYDKESNLIRIDHKEVTRDPATGQVASARYFAEMFQYDELKRLIEKKNTLRSIRYAYDSRGNLVQVIDPLGCETVNNFDIFSRLIATTQQLHHFYPADAPVPVTVQFSYNLDDQKVTQVDALGRITSFEYDSAGRLASTILPDGSRDLRSYDRASNLVEVHDRNNLIKRLTWDELNRNTLVQIDRSQLAPGVEVETSLQSVSQFDALGRLVHAENGFVINHFNYDSLNNRLKEVTSFKPATGLDPTLQFSVEREFNHRGALTRLTYPSGRQISYQRDLLDRVIQIKQELKGQPYPGDPATPNNLAIAEIQYEGLKRKRIIRNSGASTEYRNDFEGRTVEIKHSTNQGNILTLQFLYDRLGNIVQVIEEAADYQGTQRFEHDSLSWLYDVRDSSSAALLDLASIAPPASPIPDPLPDLQSQIDALLLDLQSTPARTYTYDRSGSRNESTSGSNTLIYHTNNLDQYIQVNSSTYRFDPNGNLVEDPDFHYVYDHRNQLAQIERKQDGAKFHFFYDAFGRRSLQTGLLPPKIMIYDTHNQLEEYENSNLALSLLTDTIPSGNLVASQNGAEFFFFTDLAQSVRYVYRGSQKHNFYRYDEFGNLELSLHPTDDNSFLYAGKRLLEQINKYDFIFRTYDPSLGRFLQRDPHGYGNGPNLYTFVGNNPLVFTDPLGLDRKESNSIPSRPTVLPPSLVTTPNPLPDIPLIDLPQAPPGTNFKAAEAAGRANIRNLIPFRPGQQAQHYLKWRVGRDVNLDPEITNDPRYMGPLQSRNALSNGPYIFEGRIYNNPHTLADRGVYPYYEQITRQKTAWWGTERVIHVNTSRRVQGYMTGDEGPRPPYIIMPTIKGIIGYSLYSFAQNFVPGFGEAELAAFCGMHWAWSQGFIGLGNALEFVGMRALPVVGSFVVGWMFGSWIDEKTGWGNSLTDRALRNKEIYEDMGLGEGSSRFLGGLALFPILSEAGEGIGNSLGWMTVKYQELDQEINKRLTSDDYTVIPWKTQLWSDVWDLF